MELVTCVHCRRHVGVRETVCPFCASALPAQRPQHVPLRGRLSRAAIFSAAAALVGCDSKPSTPAPVPAHGSGSGSGSADDLEKMLDVDQHVVDHPAPPADAAVDAIAIAATVDAGVPVDAGVDPAVVAEQRRRREAERKRREQERLRREQQLIDQQIMRQNVAKPYGAPPARRRVV
jgi:hypothetical protein